MSDDMAKSRAGRRDLHRRSLYARRLEFNQSINNNKKNGEGSYKKRIDLDLYK